VTQRKKGRVAESQAEPATMPNDKLSDAVPLVETEREVDVHSKEEIAREHNRTLQKEQKNQMPLHDKRPAASNQTKRAEGRVMQPRQGF